MSGTENFLLERGAPRESPGGALGRALSVPLIQAQRLLPTFPNQAFLTGEWEKGQEGSHGGEDGVGR